MPCRATTLTVRTLQVLWEWQGRDTTHSKRKRKRKVSPSALISAIDEPTLILWSVIDKGNTKTLVVENKDQYLVDPSIRVFSSKSKGAHLHEQTLATNIIKCINCIRSQQWSGAEVSWEPTKKICERERRTARSGERPYMFAWRRSLGCSSWSLARRWTAHIFKKRCYFILFLSFLNAFFAPYVQACWNGDTCTLQQTWPVFLLVQLPLTSSSFLLAYQVLSRAQWDYWENEEKIK